MQQLILGISYAIYLMMDPYRAYDGIILHGCLTSAVPLRSQKLQVTDDMKKDWFQIDYQKNSFFSIVYCILFYFMHPPFQPNSPAACAIKLFYGRD